MSGIPFIGGNPLLGITAAVVAGLAVFAGGAYVGGKVGYDGGFKAGKEVYENKAHTGKYDLLWSTGERVTTERNQCVGQVAKVNTEIDRQRSENVRILEIDRQNREAALDRASAAASRAAAESAETKIRMREGSDALKKLADVCVNAGAPADYVGVLNSVISRTTGLGGVREVPRSEANH